MWRRLAEERYHSAQIWRLKVVQGDAVEQSKYHTYVGQGAGYVLVKAARNSSLIIVCPKTKLKKTHLKLSMSPLNTSW